MKKLLLVICAVFLLASPVVANAACTAQEFQKEVMDLQTNLTELSKDQSKVLKANEAIEKEFNTEVMEFAKFAQTAAGDASKTQEMLDKGCDLYGRMNKRLQEFR